MITKTLHDTEFVPRGTPVRFVDWIAGEVVLVELPDGRQVEMPTSAVEAGHEPEESLPALAERTGIPYDTLARYVREGRILARKSGGIWLTTRTAIEYVGIKPRE